MKTIWKYPFFGRPGDSILIEMPAEAEILRFALQADTPTVWAAVSPNNAPVKRKFAVIGTGWEFPDNAAYLGTIEQGPFVWHGFEFK